MAQQRAGAREESHHGYEEGSLIREGASALPAGAHQAGPQSRCDPSAGAVHRKGDRRAGGARADRGQRCPGGRRWPGCGLAYMHELQARLGDDSILRFSVHGGESWLTAEKQDSSQRVEAATTEQLVKIVEATDAQGDDGAAADG
jgi:hypothetical protein